MMASRAFDGDAMNTLLDAAFGSLHEMGEGPYERLLRDEMMPREVVAFLRRTAARHPAVWGKVRRGLGLSIVGRWGVGLARSMMSASA